MLAVLLRVVGLVRADPVGGDQGAVDDDVITLAEVGEGFLQDGRPRSQNIEGLVDVSPGGGLRYPETGSELRERLVLAQVAKNEQRLLETIEHGRIRNQQGPSGRRCVDWNHHAHDEGPCLVTTPADQLISLLRHTMKEVRSSTSQRPPGKRIAKVVGVNDSSTTREELQTG